MGSRLLLLLTKLYKKAVCFVARGATLNVALTSGISLVMYASPILAALLSCLFEEGRPFAHRLICKSVVTLVKIKLIIFGNDFVLGVGPLKSVLSLATTLV